MKKNLILCLAAIAFSITAANAQNPGPKERLSPEKRAENQARNMAAKILLSDAQTAQFVPIYKEYSLKMLEAFAKNRPEREKIQNGERTPKSDSEIDADIRKEFKLSQEILDIRVAYYEKFLKVLSPRQIKEMYKEEKCCFEHRGGKPGPKMDAQGCRSECRPGGCEGVSHPRKMKGRPGDEPKDKS